MNSHISINVLSLSPAAFDHQVEAVARIGSRAITPDIGQLGDVSSTLAARLIGDAGLQAAALTHRAFGFGDAAETQMACERLERSIEYASAIGAPAIVMTTGRRGALNWADAATRFVEGIAPCVAQAQTADIKLGIEPTSHLYADVSITHRLSDCNAIARQANVTVVIDLFACWTDSNIDEAITAAAPITSLVQVSDYVYGDRGLPCRAVLGDGVVPLDRLIQSIIAAGFRGTFDLEIIGPRLKAEGTEMGLKRAADVLGGLLQMAGLE